MSQSRWILFRRSPLRAEAWWVGRDFAKDYKGQTPPARAPASSQLIVLRVRVRSPYLTGGRPNL